MTSKLSQVLSGFSWGVCIAEGTKTSMATMLRTENMNSVLLTLWKGSKNIEENNNYNNDAPQHATT